MAEVKSYVRMWPLAFAAIGVAGLVYAGFQWFGADRAATDDGGEPAVPVVDPGPDEHYEKVRPYLVDEFSSYRGEVNAGSPVTLRAPQGMRVPVEKIHHEAGDFVKKGDLLVTLNRTQIDKAIQEAKEKGDTVNETRFRSYLDFVEFRATFDGVVVSIDRTLGEVPLDDGVGLVTIQDKDAFRFVVRVPGDVQRLSMQLNSKFDVELDEGIGTVRGTVTEFEAPIGSDVPVVLALAPHEGIEDRLAGTVRVASGRIEAGLIPKTAVKKRGDVPIVRVWDAETKSIGEKTVKLGAEIDIDVVVLAGVFAGDSVIVPGRKPPE